MFPALEDNVSCGVFIGIGFTLMLIVALGTKDSRLSSICTCYIPFKFFDGDHVSGAKLFGTIVTIGFIHYCSPPSRITQPNSIERSRRTLDTSIRYDLH